MFAQKMGGWKMMSLIEIIYTKDTVQKPLVYEMSRKFEVVFNIYRAHVTGDCSGHLVLELEGSSKAIHGAVEFIEAAGARVCYLEPSAIVRRDS